MKLAFLLGLLFALFAITFATSQIDQTTIKKTITTTPSFEQEKDKERLERANRRLRSKFDENKDMKDNKDSTALLLPKDKDNKKVSTMHWGRGGWGRGGWGGYGRGWGGYGRGYGWGGYGRGYGWGGYGRGYGWGGYGRGYYGGYGYGYPYYGYGYGYGYPYYGGYGGYYC